MRPDDVIAAFYDTHPYPPPVDDLGQALEGWDEARRRVEHFRHWPTLPYEEEREILVAGCGTSQAVRWAARYPKASVVGIDVSPSSLSATRALAERHTIDNLELRELPIEEVTSLGRRFDLIVCTGVLHHLLDPVIGLQALRNVLTDEGALQMMVYAEYGRFGISMLREYGQRLGLGPEDLDGLVGVLKEIPLGHPISQVLRETPDFNDPDAIADALLNPRETSYSVPALFDLLDKSGMGFSRWVRQAPYRPQCGIMRQLPHARLIAAMDDVDQFAAMELFRGTIVRHNLIAFRDDSPVARLDWGSDAWRSYVPLVPASVVVVKDRLPTGMAAAVINRAHVDRDLVCFLDREELSLFESMDGGTPFGEIPDGTNDLAHRLWLHDLVVIDASSYRVIDGPALT